MKPVMPALALLVVSLVGCATDTPAPSAPSMSITAPRPPQPFVKGDSRVVFTVDSKGGVYSGSYKIRVEDMPLLARGSKVLIRADSAVPYDLMKEIMVTLGEAGISDIIFSTYEE